MGARNGTLERDAWADFQKCITVHTLYPGIKYSFSNPMNPKAIISSYRSPSTVRPLLNPGRENGHTSVHVDSHVDCMCCFRRTSDTVLSPVTVSVWERWKYLDSAVHDSRTIAYLGSQLAQPQACFLYFPTLDECRYIDSCVSSIYPYLLSRQPPLFSPLQKSSMECHRSSQSSPSAAPLQPRPLSITII